MLLPVLVLVLELELALVLVTESVLLLVPEVPVPDVLVALADVDDSVALVTVPAANKRQNARIRTARNTTKHASKAQQANRALSG